MSQAEHDQRIDYIEWAVTNVAEAKRFYHEVFGWNFKDYGPDYASFHDGRMGGGVYMAEEVKTGGVLLVVYATNLEAAQAAVIKAGGKIVRDTFSFPGGRRFHFTDPSGNELAVWSE